MYLTKSVLLRRTVGPESPANNMLEIMVMPGKVRIELSDMESADLRPRSRTIISFLSIARKLSLHKWITTYLFRWWTFLSVYRVEF